MWFLVYDNGQTNKQTSRQTGRQTDIQTRLSQYFAPRSSNEDTKRKTDECKKCERKVRKVRMNLDGQKVGFLV